MFGGSVFPVYVPSSGEVSVAPLYINNLSKDDSKSNALNWMDMTLPWGACMSQMLRSSAA